MVVAEGVLRFDEKVLPAVALPDTTTWLRAFGWATDDDDLCEDFVEAMLFHGKTLLMAAPSVSELIRGDASRKIPNRKGIVPVAFDVIAATQLGLIAPKEWLSEFPDGSRTYVKYDAMIVACAKRWGASCVVSLDGKPPMMKVAKAAPIDLFPPQRFLLPVQGEIAKSKHAEKIAKKS